MLNRLEGLVFESPVASWLKLRDGRFLAFSPSFASGLGLVASDAPRTRDTDFFCDSEVRRFRDHDRRVSSVGRADVLLEPPDSLTPAAWGATVKIPIQFLDGATVGFSHSLDTLLPLEQLVLAPPGEGPDSEDSSISDRLRSHLNRQFQDQIRVSDLARALRRHPDHLARCFRRRVGSTIGRYVTARRVAWTARRLVRTDRPIAEIALEAGFYDQSHMNRAFRSILGTTPARYRRLESAPWRFSRLAQERSADALRGPRAALRIATASGSSRCRG